MIVRTYDSLAVPRASGKGILVGTFTPDWGWRDIIGTIRPDPLGVNAPTLGVYRGAVRDYHYGASEKADLLFHIPHDYCLGTDIFLHLHWSHVGTAISGSLILDYAVTYAKGHNQSAFVAPVTPQQSIATPDIATIPQYRHRIDEFQLSAAAPSATQLDTDEIEPDGIILVGLTVNTIPTISGGVTNEPFLHTLDVHYQSTNMATAQKTPDFYT